MPNEPNEDDPGDLDMLLPIGKVAERTGVSVNTIRAWAQRGLLSPAERRLDKKGYTWHTTIRAVQKRRADPPKMGRPPKIGT